MFRQVLAYAAVGTLLSSGLLVSAQEPTSAVASDTIPMPFFPLPPLPPPVQSVNSGFLTGALQIRGVTLPFTGTLDYLASGGSQNIKLSIDTAAAGQPITSDSWVTITPTGINAWEIVSTDPTTCRKEVLSGDSYPQCTPWNQVGNALSLGCTVTVQGKKATLNILAVTNSNNQLVQLQENTTISGITGSTIIQVTSQSTTPPPASDFALPSICPAP
jgi:hypothetical protein